MEKNTQIFNFKINLAGESGAGKSSLLNREIDDNYGQNYHPPIGYDFRCKTFKFGNQETKATIWDPSGTQRYRVLSSRTFKGSHAVLFCFDLNNKQSFLSLQKAIKQIQLFDIKIGKCYLVGCKSDLQQKVTMEEIQQYCKMYNITYFQTSAKQNHGVHEIFSIVVDQALNRERENPNSNKNNIKLLLKPEKKGYCY